MSIESNLIRAKVSVKHFNVRSCKKELNIHIKRLSTIPFKKPFKISFFMLTVLSLLLVFLNSLFIFIFKGISETITKANLTLPDYMFTIMYFIVTLNTFFFYY